MFHISTTTLFKLHPSLLEAQQTNFHVFALFIVFVDSIRAAITQVLLPTLPLWVNQKNFFIWELTAFSCHVGFIYTKSAWSEISSKTSIPPVIRSMSHFFGVHKSFWNDCCTTLFTACIHFTVWDIKMFFSVFITNNYLFQLILISDQYLTFCWHCCKCIWFPTLCWVYRFYYKYCARSKFWFNPFMAWYFCKIWRLSVQMSHPNDQLELCTHPLFRSSQNYFSALAPILYARLQFCLKTYILQPSVFKVTDI